MPSCQAEETSATQLPLLQSKVPVKSLGINASSLLSLVRAVQSSQASHPYKTLSVPIDSLIGVNLRPGFALQISSPPGMYIEQLVLGVIKNVTQTGGWVTVVDMQNKLVPAVISSALNQGFSKIAGDAYFVSNHQAKDDRAKVYYQRCFALEDVLKRLAEDLPSFFRSHPEVSLLVLSSLSSPVQLEPHFAKRKSYSEKFQKLISKLCHDFSIAVVITSNMSTQFAKPDGSKGTFHNDNTGVLTPQIDLSCETIGSLVLSRSDRTSGRATLKIREKAERSVDFSYQGVDFVQNVQKSQLN